MLRYSNELARLELMLRALERNNPALDLHSREEALNVFSVFGGVAELEASLKDSEEIERLATDCLRRIHGALFADETIH